MAWKGQLWGPEGQRSRSHEADDRFGRLAKASFLTSLGRVSFLVFTATLLLVDYGVYRFTQKTSHVQFLEDLSKNWITRHCPSVRSSVTKLKNTIFWKQMHWFWCQLALVVQRQLWGQEVKGQGHLRPKIDLEAWRRNHSWLRWVD